jgi:hypothetical protein
MSATEAPSEKSYTELSEFLAQKAFGGLQPISEIVDFIEHKGPFRLQIWSNSIPISKEASIEDAIVRYGFDDLQDNSLKLTGYAIDKHGKVRASTLDLDLCFRVTYSHGLKAIHDVAALAVDETAEHPVSLPSRHSFNDPLHLYVNQANGDKGHPHFRHVLVAHWRADDKYTFTDLNDYVRRKHGCIEFVHPP